MVFKSLPEKCNAKFTYFYYFLDLSALIPQNIESKNTINNLKVFNNKISNLPILKNDTSNVIEFNDGFK